MTTSRTSTGAFRRSIRLLRQLITRQTPSGSAARHRSSTKQSACWLSLAASTALSAASMAITSRPPDPPTAAAAIVSHVLNRRHSAVSSCAASTSKGVPQFSDSSLTSCFSACRGACRSSPGSLLWPEAKQSYSNTTELEGSFDSNSRSDVVFPTPASPCMTKCRAPSSTMARAKTAEFEVGSISGGHSIREGHGNRSVWSYTPSAVKTSCLQMPQTILLQAMLGVLPGCREH